MTIDRHQIDVGGVPVEVVRKEIKNLHVGVYPPSGRVRVAAPLRMADEAVRLAVVSRLGWIRRQQAAFDQQDRQSHREMVTGESHYFQGRRYLLDVIEHRGVPTVHLADNTTMELRVRPRGRSRRVRCSPTGVVSTAAPRATSPTAREVGTKGRRDRRRTTHQEDEDAVG